MEVSTHCEKYSLQRLDFYLRIAFHFHYQNGEYISRFYLGCNFVNERARLGVVHRIEIKVTSPKKHVHTFVWNSFCKHETSDAGIQRESSPYPIAVIPKNNQNLFIEFESTVPISREWWEVGRYEFKVMGWMNKENKTSILNRRRNMESKFHINITESMHSVLMEEHEVRTLHEAEVLNQQVVDRYANRWNPNFRELLPVYYSIPVEEWNSSPPY